MHILIIGAAGMVGRKLSEPLVKDGQLGQGGSPGDAAPRGRAGAARNTDYR